MIPSNSPTTFRRSRRMTKGRSRLSAFTPLLTGRRRSAAFRPAGPGAHARPAFRRHAHSRRHDGAVRRPVRLLRRLWIAAILALAACAPVPVQKPVETPARPVRTVADAARYRVVADGTLVYARVFRGGSLSKLGHNHVIEFPDVRGDIFVAGEIGKSLFDISVTPAGAVVDPADLRKSQGAEFNTTISDNARARTRQNMLGREVLDAADYPYVNISSTSIEGSLKKAMVTVDLTLKGVTRSMTIPVAIDVDDDRLIAKGRFALLQSAFGMEPFSVLGGALKVKDRVEVVFTIAAHRIN